MLDVQSTLWLINGRIQVTMMIMPHASVLGAVRVTGTSPAPSPLEPSRRRRAGSHRLPRASCDVATAALPVAGAEESR
jgi:hypothetical protein